MLPAGSSVLLVATPPHNPQRVVTASSTQIDNITMCLSVSFFVPLTPLSLFLLQPIVFFIVSTCVSLDLFAVACVFFKLKSPRPGDLCVDPSKPMVRSMAHRSYSNLDVRIKSSPEKKIYVFSGTETRVEIRP